MSRRDPTPWPVVWRAGWPALAVIVLHAVAGRAFGHEPVVDPVSHFLGGVAAAYFVVAVSRSPSSPFGEPSRAGGVLLVVGTTALAALVWELGELTSDLVLGTRIQAEARITLRDLGLAVLGGGLTVAAAGDSMRTRATDR
jgi:hypothetical protein